MCPGTVRLPAAADAGCPALLTADIVCQAHVNHTPNCSPTTTPPPSTQQGPVSAHVHHLGLRHGGLETRCLPHARAPPGSDNAAWGDPVQREPTKEIISKSEAFLKKDAGGDTTFVSSAARKESSTQQKKEAENSSSFLCTNQVFV